MDVSQFENTLIETCINQCKAAASLLAIVVLFSIIDIVYYCVTKNNDGFSLWSFLGANKTFKNRFTTKEQILLKVIAVIALLVWIGWIIIPAYRDISKQQYIIVRGNCTYKKTNEQSFLSNGRIRVETEEEEIFLELPSDWKTNVFSDETVYGEICYSKESKILLSFNPQP